MEVGLIGHIFGICCSWQDAQQVILPVPWAVTASFRSGSEQAPRAIVEASTQVDTALFGVPKNLRVQTYTLPLPTNWLRHQHVLRPRVVDYIRALETDQATSPYHGLLAEVNGQTEQLRTWVYQQSLRILTAGKYPVLLGGEHAITQGAIEALLTRHADIGLLQIDAHMDLRCAYMGFTHSHASVMYNLLEHTALSCLVQVGIREFAQQEQDYADLQKNRLHIFYDQQLHMAQYQGQSWHAIVKTILACLPKKVYVSFDIDGLDPSCSPHTGTPAAGGLSFAQAVYLISQLVASGRQIVGCDLVEVVPSQQGLDQSLAAQLLYRLCAYMQLSNRNT